LLGVFFATVLTGQASALYDPGVGRFCSRDPITRIYPKHATRIYNFMDNRPIDFLDPSGLAKVKPVNNSAKILPCGGWQIDFLFTSSSKDVNYNGPYIVIQKICIFQGSIRDCQKSNVCNRCEPSRDKKTCNGCCYLEILGGDSGPDKTGTYSAEDRNRILPYSGPGCKSSGGWAVTSTVKFFKLTDTFIQAIVNDLDPSSDLWDECDAGCKKIPVSLGPAKKLGLVPAWWDNSPEQFDSVDVSSSSQWTCCGPNNRQLTTIAGFPLPKWNMTINE
jgi:hypothetical protein